MLAVTVGLLCMSSALPVFAQMTEAQKDECVLASRNCRDQVDDIQTRIRRLNEEIGKGTAVYTPQELKKLQGKLAEVQALLRNMEKR